MRFAFFAFAFESIVFNRLAAAATAAGAVVESDAAPPLEVEALFVSSRLRFVGEAAEDEAEADAEAEAEAEEEAEEDADVAEDGVADEVDESVGRLDFCFCLSFFLSFFFGFNAMMSDGPVPALRVLTEEDDAVAPAVAE